MSDSSRFEVNGKDYREMSPAEYAAAIYRVIDEQHLERGLTETQATALKFTLFMESNARWDAYPVKRYSESAMVELHGAEAMQKDEPPEGFTRHSRGDGDSKRVWYQRVINRKREDDGFVQKYESSTDAYSALQMIPKTRNAVWQEVEDLAGELPDSHPQQQAIAGMALSAWDAAAVRQGMKNRGMDVADPFAVAGVGANYIAHLAGALRTSDFMQAMHDNPNTPLKDVWPASYFESNAGISIPHPEEEGKRLPIAEWEVRHVPQWVVGEKFELHLDNVVQAESLNRPGVPIDQIRAELRAMIDTQGAILEELIQPDYIDRLGISLSAPEPIEIDSSARLEVDEERYALLFPVPDEVAALHYPNISDDIAQLNAQVIDALDAEIRSDIYGWANDVSSVGVIASDGENANYHAYQFTNMDTDSKAQALTCLLEDHDVQVAGFVDSAVTKGDGADELVVLADRFIEAQGCHAGSFGTEEAKTYAPGTSTRTEAHTDVIEDVNIADAVNAALTGVQLEDISDAADAAVLQALGIGKVGASPKTR